MTIRFGVLGAGRIGRIHGRNLAANPRATLVAVADASEAAARSLTEATGAQMRESGAIIGSRDIDAVVIATPTDTHAELIEHAARAGKAIFCEKPVDLSSDRIERCLAVVAGAGTALMIGFNRRFDPSFAAVKRRLEAGEIGLPEIVTIISRDPAPPPVSYIERSGGLFRDMMIHDLDMARFLLGEEPVQVQAMGAVLVDPAIGEAGDVDTAGVMLRTASGRIALISNSRRATYGYDQRIEVHGSRGLLKAENWRPTSVEVATGAGYTTDPVMSFFLERYEVAYRAEMDAFIDALEAGRAPDPSGEDGLKAQRLADAATRAAASGEAVRVD